MIERPVTPPVDAPLAWGTVGWPDDGGDFYELGDSSNDGKTLVRVTLFRGRAPDAPLDQSQAQGTRLLSQIGGGLFYIPPRGTQVLVAIPEPYGQLPGASTIIGTSEQNAVAGTLAPGELCLGASSGGQGRILVKDDGSVTIYTAQDNTSGGQSVVIQVLPNGGINVASSLGALTLSSSGWTLMFGSTAGIQIDSTGVTLIGPAIKLNGGSVILGTAAGALGVAVGPQPGVVSTSVFAGL